MATTRFENNVTIVTAEFLNDVYQHIHDGFKEEGSDYYADGHAHLIGLEHLDAALAAIINDLIGIRPLIQQLYFGDKVKANVFGGFGGDGNYTGGNLDRENYEFTNFFVASEDSIQVTQGFTRIRCTGSVTINGTLFGVPLNQYGLGKAWFNNGGRAYNLKAQLGGSGGYETVDHTDIAGLTTIRDPGGLGGSCIVIEALGLITVNGTITCPGGNAGVAQIISGSPILGGSGGGSGGSIILQSYTGIQVNGTLECPGGNGANGFGSNASGGGGGGGGIVYTISPENNILPGAINVSGGTPGTTNGSGARQGGGGGGNGGMGGNHRASGSSGKIINMTRNIFNAL